MCDAVSKGEEPSASLPQVIHASAPLELFSDVWGPRPTSVGRSNFYVRFIDDFSKFTWIYLLKHKSEVFERFYDFKNLVERQFDRKILCMQTDLGGVNIKN